MIAVADCVVWYKRCNWYFWVLTALLWVATKSVTMFLPGAEVVHCQMGLQYVSELWMD